MHWNIMYVLAIQWCYCLSVAAVVAVFIWGTEAWQAGGLMLVVVVVVVKGAGRACISLTASDKLSKHLWGSGEEVGNPANVALPYTHSFLQTLIPLFIYRFVYLFIHLLMYFVVVVVVVVVVVCYYYYVLLMCLYINQSIKQRIYLSFNQSICLSIYLSIYRSSYLSIYPSIMM